MAGDWLAEQEARMEVAEISSRMCKGYELGLRRYGLPAFVPWQVRSIGSDHLVAWIRKLREAGYAPHFVHNYGGPRHLRIPRTTGRRKLFHRQGAGCRALRAVEDRLAVLRAGRSAGQGRRRMPPGCLETDFERGRSFANERDYQLQLDGWFERANARTHKTLRCRPVDRLQERRARWWRRCRRSPISTGAG